jgi:hypothetical protein
MIVNWNQQQVARRKIWVEVCMKTQLGFMLSLVDPKNMQLFQQFFLSSGGMSCPCAKKSQNLMVPCTWK